MNSLTYAARTHTSKPNSQLYLWMVSRLNMGKVVQRLIIAERTPMPVKMVLAEYNFEETLPCGMPIRVAMRKYGGTALAQMMVPNTTAYIRRKPTGDGLSSNVYQVVVVWNQAFKQPGTSV